MPRSGQPWVSPTRTSWVAKRIALPAARRGSGSGSERRQAAAASLQVSGEDAHVVRRLDAFERPGRPRIDLDDPGALAVPHEVHAEQPAQLERQGQVRAYRLRRFCKRASLHLPEPRRHDVSAPRVSARPKPALTNQLFAHAEQGGRAPVGDGRGRACKSRDVLLHHDVPVQRPAAPLANAASAAAADRLAQPATGALGPPRRVGAAERRRVGEAGRPQRGAERRRVADPLERLAPCTRAASCRMPAGRRDPAGSRVPRRRSRSAPEPSPPRPPAPPCRRDRRGRAARRRSGRAAADRDRRSGRRQRRRGPPSRPARPACAR